MTKTWLAPQGALGCPVARLVAVCLIGFMALFSSASVVNADPEMENPYRLIAFREVQIERWLAETIISAAEKTGVNSAYLMALADKESSFRPQARAGTSSAEGLFQFIESTWLETLRAHGAKHGFEAAANAITVVQGRYTIADPQNREWVLGLRCDPYLAALMAGELVNQHRERLVDTVQRTPTGGELYLAHFLGASGAARLIRLADEKPEANAPKAFPKAARANKAIFFRRNAQMQEDRTVSEVHARISSIIEARLERYQDLATPIL